MVEVHVQLKHSKHLLEVYNKIDVVRNKEFKIITIINDLSSSQLPCLKLYVIFHNSILGEIHLNLQKPPASKGSKSDDSCMIPSIEEANAFLSRISTKEATVE